MYATQDKRCKRTQHFILRERKLYLSIECVAFSTLWEFFNDIFKAFHGYLHRQRIIACISLAILFEKEGKKGKNKTPPDRIPQKAHQTSTHFLERCMQQNNYKSHRLTCLYILPNLFRGTYHVSKSLT